MKKNRILLMAIFLIIVGSATVILAESKTNLDRSESESLIAEIPSKNVMITKQDYVELKANLEFMEKQSETKIDRSDETIIKRLVIEELLIVHAEELGITASNDEIMNEINNVQKALTTEQDDELMKEIFKNLVRKSGVSEEDYWKLDDVREQYRRLVLNNKLIAHYDFGGPEEFEVFKNNLYDEHKHQLHIYSENIE